MRHKRLPASTFTVEYPAPLDIPASLDIFRRTGDDGLDRWDGRVLVRTTRVADTVVPFIGTVVGTVDAPALEVTVAHAHPCSSHRAHSADDVCDSACSRSPSLSPLTRSLPAWKRATRDSVPSCNQIPSPPLSVLSVPSKSTYDGPRPPAVGSPRRLGVSTHSAPTRSSALLPNVSPLSMSWPYAPCNSPPARRNTSLHWRLR